MFNRFYLFEYNTTFYVKNRRFYQLNHDTKKIKRISENAYIMYFEIYKDF